MFTLLIKFTHVGLIVWISLGIKIARVVLHRHSAHRTGLLLTKRRVRVGISRGHGGSVLEGAWHGLLRSKMRTVHTTIAG